ncbi:MAG: hypothetical protein LBK99_00595 [Opitutaceae bacterium]|nr:hypothetical protein [Opitutaceae bacterium]
MTLAGATVFALLAASATAATSAATTANPPANALPPLPDGQPAALFIPASRDTTTTPPVFKNGPLVHGKLVTSNAGEIRTTPDGMIVLRRDGHHKNTAHFRFDLPAAPDNLPAGRYEIWTRFTQGGNSSQTFAFMAGAAGSSMDERARFRQSARSWDMQWRKAPEPLSIFPADRILDIRIDGSSTRQIQIAGLVLARAGDLPAGATIEEARTLEKAVPEPLAGNTPARWLVLASGAGPAGLSLWSLDYEPEVRPNPEGAEPLLRFDNGNMDTWKPASPAPDATRDVVIEKLRHSLAWSQGAAYAHIYVHAPEARRLTLAINQTGHTTGGWLNGRALAWSRGVTVRGDSAAADTGNADGPIEDTDLNDQGGVMRVRRETGRRSQTATLALDPGWNRLLLKLVTGQKKDESFAFASRLDAADGKPLDAIRTSLANPAPALFPRSPVSRFVPAVYTNAPFNMPYAGEPLTLDVDIGSVDKLARQLAPVTQPFDARFHLRLVVTDYDGVEILRRDLPGFTLPGRASFDLGPAPARGYYATHLKLFDDAGNLLVAYPGDGFSVIGGTAAQHERKADKKMAVTYYFMAGKELYKTLYFPYMKRIGIFRNIGGNNTWNEEFYKTAAEEKILLSADLWTHRKTEYVRDYVEGASPYVDSFKAFNEVDIVPSQRGTPESWVAKVKQDYELVKKANPAAFYLGGSLVRPAADSWFGECLKLGLADWQDAWDVHCYPKIPPVLEGSLSNGPNETELGVLNVYKKLGMKNTKPFWIGETGARCSHGYDARRWQAAMVAKMTACVLSREDFRKIGFLVPWWYARTRGKHLVGDIEAGHMPAEAAYYTASALIDGFDYRRIESEKRIQAAHFGPTLMAWTTDTSRPVTFRHRPEGKGLSSGPFVLVDVVGRVTNLAPDAIASDGTLALTLTLTDSPVYLLARADYERLTRF